MSQMLFCRKRRDGKLFDFLSYVRDTGLEVRVLPPSCAGVFISLEVRDPKTCFRERYDITNSQVRGCGNIDTYTGFMLDRIAAKIGSRKAQLYANRHGSNKMREAEDFFRSKDFFQQET